MQRWILIFNLQPLTFKIITVMGRIIKFLLICLGFKSLTACDVEVWQGTVEYGTPYAEYEVKGRVSDAEGTPISGVRVSIGEENLVDSVAVTDVDGRFHVNHGTHPFNNSTFDILFTDIDGEAGGGLFESDTVTVRAELVKEGENTWDSGDYAVPGEVEVTLYHKTESGE